MQLLIVTLACVLVGVTTKVGCIELQYKEKVVSGRKGDLFASALDSYNQNLVIGAPEDKERKGSVIVTPGRTKIHPPEGNFFGKSVGINKQFIVVSGAYPCAVYVYTADPPNTLKARLPLNTRFFVQDVAIANDSTVIVAINNHKSYVLNVFHYDTDAWHLATQMNFPPAYASAVTISGNHMAVGFPGGAEEQGRVHVYRRQRNIWVKRQTLNPPKESLVWFGSSIMVHGECLAVSSKADDLSEGFAHVYRIHPSAGIWSLVTSLLVPGRGTAPSVAVHRDIIAVTVNDKKNPEAVGIVFKRTNDEVKGGSWKEEATLKTNGLPLELFHQTNSVVSVEDDHVFTGRIDERTDGFGAVFVHKLSQN